MEIKKRLNNNVIQVIDNNGNNLIIMGNGIGFQAYPGDRVNESKIERQYILKEDEASDAKKIADIMASVPGPVIAVAEKIVSDSQKHFEQELNLSLLFSVADHLHSAINRSNEGIQITNPLHWEVKELYPTETEIGKKALLTVEKELGVSLDERESTSIALHFLAQRQSIQSINQAQSFTEIIARMISIIQYHFQIEVDQSSVYFSRFITHVQYFLARQIKGQPTTFNDDDLMEMVLKKYHDEFACSEKIMTYLHEVKDMKPTISEQLYLILHIRRLVQSE